CDLDGRVNSSCTFGVHSCLNVTDTRQLDANSNPVCTPLDVVSIEVKVPKYQNPDYVDNPDYVGVTQYTEIQRVIGASFPSTFTGHCTAPRSDVGFACLKNQDCDESEDGGDGRCSAPKFELTTPITDTN